MIRNDRSTVVGIFDDRAHANEAIADLRSLGFRDNQIGVAMRHSNVTTGATATNEDTYAEEGAAAGIVSGLGLGALAGLGVLGGMLPVIGPAIAGGTLGIILSNAALGAGVAGLAGALIGWGIPEEEAKYYQSELEAGRTIVTVRPEGRAGEAWRVLEGHGAYEMATRTVGAHT